MGRRAAHTATALADGSVLVAGGCDVDGCERASRSALLLGAGGARPTTDLLRPRDGHVAVRVPDGRVLVVGGYGGEGQAPLAPAETFDPPTDRFVPGPDLPVAADGLAATALRDGSVLVTGGQVRSEVATAAAAVIAADGRSARPVGPMITARFKHAVVVVLHAQPGRERALAHRRVRPGHPADRPGAAAAPRRPLGDDEGLNRGAAGY